MATGPQITTHRTDHGTPEWRGTLKLPTAFLGPVSCLSLLGMQSALGGEVKQTSTQPIPLLQLSRSFKQKYCVPRSF